MQIVKKTNLSFYLMKESVVMEIPSKGQRIGDTYVSFNCYHVQSRKKFYQFTETLATSRPNEYDSVNDAFGLAREYEVRSSNGYKPRIVGNIAF